MSFRFVAGDCRSFVSLTVACLLGTMSVSVARAANPTGTVRSLDGAWKIVADPKNIGSSEKWFTNPPTSAAKNALVPGIIQQALPDYHGVAWYWRAFDAPANPCPGGRYILRFWAVDYLAQVWVNGTAVGGHEGGETPFELDATDAIHSGGANLVVVRVLNPIHDRIDDITLNETAHRNKTLPYAPGNAWDTGGFMDSAELLVTPAVRIADLWVRPHWPDGKVHVQAIVRNTLKSPAQAQIEFGVLADSTGDSIGASRQSRTLAPGDSVVEAELTVPGARPWELNDPALYRLCARLDAGDSQAESSVRFGFRELRIENGYFRLNGKRLFFRCSHTGNCTPVTLAQVPVDPDQLRRDLINVKAMGFNAIRFIAGMPTRYQLDLCDQIGLMVYEECLAAWEMGDSPKLAQRFDESTREMILRDRNHPSVGIWGLLNETNDGPVFRHATTCLPLVRALDDTRLVFLNAGRFDNAYPSAAGALALHAWHGEGEVDPNVTFNSAEHPLSINNGVVWGRRQFAMHPGKDGQFSVARFTAPADDAGAAVECTFAGIAKQATTDVHVLHNGEALFDSGVNVGGNGNSAHWAGQVKLAAGDTIDFVVGYGNGNYGGDTTALQAVISSGAKKIADIGADFSATDNPSGPWRFGFLRPGPRPDPASFVLYRQTEKNSGFGSISNPGSDTWEDPIRDVHDYPRVPHTASTIVHFRALDGGTRAVFLSEYGIGSAVDLVGIVKQYEQMGAPDAEDARFYRGLRDRFLDDFARWKMADTFPTPENYFHQALAKMASLRAGGIDAIRANSHMIGYSLTGTVDQGMTGEGLFTTWRGTKPGTFDALFESLAPLHWCVFVEPRNVYRGRKARVDVVLADEDALRPGKYDGRVRVVAPDGSIFFEKPLSIQVPSPREGAQPPFAIPCLSEEVTVSGPAGHYRVIAELDHADPTGGDADFHADDPSLMPEVAHPVALFGVDPRLANWLAAHAIHASPLQLDDESRRSVILVGPVAPPDPANSFAKLARRIARGSTAIFLSPAVFRQDPEHPLAYLPLEHKGSVQNVAGWLYLKDEWCKRHPIFDGLPNGGLMDYGFYRDLIPDALYAGQDPPADAVAGAIQASIGYQSGLMTSVYGLGQGRFILNTLLIEENLDSDPAAERLLRNLLNFASRGTEAPVSDLPADFARQLRAMGLPE